MGAGRGDVARMVIGPGLIDPVVTVLAANGRAAIVLATTVPVATVQAAIVLATTVPVATDRAAIVLDTTDPVATVLAGAGHPRIGLVTTVTGMTVGLRRGRCGRLGRRG